MPDLIAIVRATKASASALNRMRHHASKIAEHQREYDKARDDYARAQAILAANPLPGDVQ